MAAEDAGVRVLTGTLDLIFNKCLCVQNLHQCINRIVDKKNDGKIVGTSNLQDYERGSGERVFCDESFQKLSKSNPDSAQHVVLVTVQICMTHWKDILFAYGPYARDVQHVLANGSKNSDRQERQRTKANEYHDQTSAKSFVDVMG